MTHHPDLYAQQDRLMRIETGVAAITAHLGINTPASTTAEPEAEALASVAVPVCGGDDRAAVLAVPAGDVKMLRETLCAAQSAVLAGRFDVERQREHVDRLQRLIDQCDVHRPLGPDGVHGDLHTATCGCVVVGTGVAS